MRFARIDQEGIVLYHCHHQAVPVTQSPRCPCELKAYTSTVCWTDIETSPFEPFYDSGHPVYTVMVHESNLDNWLLAIATLMDNEDVVFHNTVKGVG